MSHGHVLCEPVSRSAIRKTRPRRVFLIPQRSLREVSRAACTLRTAPSQFRLPSTENLFVFSLVIILLPSALFTSFHIPNFSLILLYYIKMTYKTIHNYHKEQLFTEMLLTALHQILKIPGCAYQYAV